MARTKVQKATKAGPYVSIHPQVSSNDGIPTLDFTIGKNDQAGKTWAKGKTLPEAEGNPHGHGTTS